MASKEFDFFAKPLERAIVKHARRIIASFEPVCDPMEIHLLIVAQPQDQLVMGGQGRERR